MQLYATYTVWIVKLILTTQVTCWAILVNHSFIRIIIGFTIQQNMYGSAQSTAHSTKQNAFNICHRP